VKILVLDEEFPYPLNTGKRIRSYNLISRLARRHEVRYLAYGRADSEAFRRFGTDKMHPIAVAPQVPDKSGPAFYLRLFLNLFSPLPYVVTSHYSDLFQQAVLAAVGREKPDLVLCEWSPYARFVQSISTVKRVIVAHNIEYRIWKRYFQNEPQALKRWYIGLQMHKMHRFEQEAFRWADGATAVAEFEAQEIRTLSPHTRVETIENGVDLRLFHGGDRGPTGHNVVFTGSMDWRPNQDCAVYFVQDILPLIKEKYPDVITTFVGRNPPAHIRKLGERPGVRITGTVDDVRPYIEGATVYIVPLRIGGGSRLKILEALAMKIPVVSTSVGAEGLKVTDGENILLADTPEKFAGQVARLFTDDDLRRKLGDNGRRLVEEHYDWDTLAVRLERFLLSLTERP